MFSQTRVGPLPRTLAGIVCMLVLLGSCGTGRPAATSGPAPPPQEAARLIVENQSTSQMRIFAIFAGQEVRIGTVNGLSTQSVRIPAYLVGGGRSLRFASVPLGGQSAATTVEMYVVPGDAVRLVIPSQLR